MDIPRPERAQGTPGALGGRRGKPVLSTAFTLPLLAALGVWVVLELVTVVGLLWFFGLAWLSGYDESEPVRAFEAIRPGMTEGEVRELVWDPRREYEAQSAPADHYEHGYTFERRPISGKVLLYCPGFNIVYVYLDKASRVEHVYIGYD